MSLTRRTPALAAFERLNAGTTVRDEATSVAQGIWPANFGGQVMPPTYLRNFSPASCWQVLLVYTEIATRFVTERLGGGAGGGFASEGSDGGHGRGRGERRGGAGGIASRKHPRILHPGCGSSTLGVVLQREHGCDVVNADFSQVLPNNVPGTTLMDMGGQGMQVSREKYISQSKRVRNPSTWLPRYTKTDVHLHILCFPWKPATNRRNVSRSAQQELKISSSHYYKYQAFAPRQATIYSATPPNHSDGKTCLGPPS